jgi:hypothetical protein
MNLLNNIFEAYKAHDFRLLDSYLRHILSRYITKYKTSAQPLDTLSNHFNVFQPSKLLTVKNNADFFDMLYRSEEDKQETKTNDGETKNSLSRDHSPQVLQPSNQDNSLNGKLQIKSEWIKSLSKVFSILDSKAIKHLLLLLEHPKETTRKMIMIMFQILLQKTQNKIHFVEKCAIGFSPGVYIISRMKYIHSVTSDFKNVFACLKAIKKYFRTVKSKLEIENKALDGNFFFSYNS